MGLLWVSYGFIGIILGESWDIDGELPSAIVTNSLLLKPWPVYFVDRLMKIDDDPVSYVGTFSRG